MALATSAVQNSCVISKCRVLCAGREQHATRQTGIGSICWNCAGTALVQCGRDLKEDVADFSSSRRWSRTLHETPGDVAPALRLQRRSGNARRRPLGHKAIAGARERLEDDVCQFRAYLSRDVRHGIRRRVCSSLELQAAEECVRDHILWSYCHRVPRFSGAPHSGHLGRLIGASPGLVAVYRGFPTTGSFKKLQLHIFVCNSRGRPGS